MSKYKSRYDTRYDTGYKVRTRTKESRSIDRAENFTELDAKESRHESLAEINSFEDEDSKPVPRSLTKEGSVRGRSLPIFIIYRINQDLSNLLQGTCLTSHGGSVKPLMEDINQDQNQFVVFVFVAYGPTRIFSQITGNEVLISYRKSEIWKTRLIGINN